MGEAIVFTSGKGGVGKTTAIANIGTGLSLLDKKVVMLDADMGLRNLDVVMGLEDRITYNLLDLLDKRCRFNQAIIRDKRYPNLYLIPAALTCEKLQEKEETFRELICSLKQEFDYCLIDCPAGIEDGFQFAVSQADRAIVVTTPHISAVRDAGRVLYILEENRFMQIDLVINEMNQRMVRRHDMLSREDIEEILGMQALGTISVDDKVIVSQNQGIPVISMKSVAGRQLQMVARRIAASPLTPADLALEDGHRRRGHSPFHRKEYRYEIS